MTVVNVLICLIILTSQSVHSKVITVSSNNGNDSTECCVKGECACSSLSTALLNISNNTIINITSESVALNNTATMGSSKLTNIAITGSNVTIMCNNSGSVYCESCDDVRIEGITWDRCGDPNGTNIAGVTFNGISNISVVNCTFQYSQLPALVLLEVSDNVIIQGCNFLSNIPIKIVNSLTGILFISRSPGFSNDVIVTIIVSEGYFYNNGYLHNNTNSAATLLLPFTVDIVDDSVVDCNVVLKNTTFISNRNGILFGINIFKLINIQLMEIVAFNNSFVGMVMLEQILKSNSSDVVLSIISSNFNTSNTKCFLIGNKISVTINDSNFTNSKLIANFTTYAPAVGIVIQANTSEITFDRVQFNNNLIGTKYGTIDDTAGAVSIINIDGDVEINMYMVKFTSNQYLGYDGGGLHIFLKDNFDSNCNIIVKACKFVNNRSPGHGAALYISIQDFESGSIQIEDTHFDQNIAGNSVVYITQKNFLQDNNIALQVSRSTFTNNAASSMYLSGCDVEFLKDVLFKNNTAENGEQCILTRELGLLLTVKQMFSLLLIPLQ